MNVRVEEVEEHFFSGGGGKKSAGKLKRWFFLVFVVLCSVLFGNFWKSKRLALYEKALGC